MGSSSGKGDCYEVSANYVVDRQRSRDTQGVTLIHGTVSGQGKLTGVRYGHAWIEVETEDAVWCLDLSNGRDIRMLREVYYAVGRIRIQETRRYTVREALDEMIKSGIYGPWAPVIGETVGEDSFSPER